METHGRYNEKLIEYENTPLWRNPVVISIILAILSAVFYVHIITTKTHSTNALTTLSKQASIRFNSVKKNASIQKQDSRFVNPKDQITRKQTVENTSIKQVNPNDIAVVRVEQKNSSMNQETIEKKDDAQNQPISKDLDAERLVIAQKVEELEKALQNQVTESEATTQNPNEYNVSDLTHVQPTEAEYELVSADSTNYSYSSDENSVMDYDSLDYTENSTDYDDTPIHPLDHKVVSNQPSLTQEQIDQLANELVVEGIDN